MKLADSEFKETNKNISAGFYHPSVHTIFEPWSRLASKTEIFIYWYTLGLVFGVHKFKHPLLVCLLKCPLYILNCPIAFCDSRKIINN